MVTRRNIVIVAVPPAQLQSVASAVRGAFRHDAVALSILAGVTEAKGAQLLGLPLLCGHVEPCGVHAAARRGGRRRHESTLPKELAGVAAQQFAGADTMDQLAAGGTGAGAGGSLHFNPEQELQAAAAPTTAARTNPCGAAARSVRVCVECICEQGQQD